MTNIIKKLFLIILAAAVFFPLAAFAQNDTGGSSGFQPRPLEIKYPSFPPTPAPTTTVSLPDFVKYIYYFAIMASGFLALVVIVIAGTQRLISTGDPTKVSDANNRLKSALAGLAILICSWLILYTINPQFVVFRTPDQLPGIMPDVKPGVYVCSQQQNISQVWNAKKQSNATPEQAAQMKETLKQIEENCYITPSAGNLPTGLQGTAKVVYLVPPVGDEESYGAIGYEKQNLQGKTMIMYNDSGSGPQEFSLPSSMSSIRPFVLLKKVPPNYKITFYELIHFNQDDKKGEYKKTECQISQTAQECMSLPKNKMGQTEIGSVKIDGEMFVIFFKDRSMGGTFNMDAEVTIVETPGDNNLNDQAMGRWKENECVERREPKWRDRYFPCATSAGAVAAHFY